MGQRVLGCRWHMGAVMGTVLPRAVLRQGGGDVTRTLLAQLSSGWGQGRAGGMELVAGRRELVDKGFLSGSDLYEKPVGPVGLGMLCARCRHCLVLYCVRE